MSGGETVDWLPAIVVLLAGLIGGLVVVFVSKRRRGELPREQDVESVGDLEQRRDLMIVRLREMEGDASEREQVEREAAGILRRIEELQHESARNKRPAAGRQARKDERGTGRARFSGFLWGLGAAAIIGLIIFFVATSTTERGEEGSLTGGIASTADAQQPQFSAELRNLEEWVAQNPDDLEARLELARVYLMQQEMMKVWDQTQYVLQQSPGHPRARGYQAVVRLAMGQTAVALEMLEQAIKDDPTLLDARIHLSLAYLQMGRPQEAVRTLEDAKEVHPSQSAMIEELVQEILQQWPEVETGS